MNNEIEIEFNVFKALCLALGDDDAENNQNGYDLGAMLFEQGARGPIAVAISGPILTCASLAGAKIKEPFLLMGARKILKKAEKLGCTRIAVPLCGSGWGRIVVVDGGGVRYSVNAFIDDPEPARYPTSWRHAMPKPGGFIGAACYISHRLLKVISKQTKLLCNGNFPGVAFYQKDGHYDAPISVAFRGCNDVFTVIMGLDAPLDDIYTYPFDARQAIACYTDTSA